MADRHQQYPMMPNFNPSMLQQQMQQQQSQSQQHQQQQQQQPDGHGGMQSFNEPSPLWSQMQNLQNQFRPNNGGDMTNPQVNQQQIQNLLQSQAIARQQQPYQLGAPQMGGPSGNASQQPPFHNQQNPILGNGFNGINGGGPSGMQPSLSQNSMQARTAMMQAFHQTHNRQLNLIDQAGNQQNQHTPINFPTRMSQPPTHPSVNQGNMGDMFAPPMGSNLAMRQPSPAQPPGMGQKPLNVPQPLMSNGQPRPNIPPELQTKMMQVRAQIAQTENNARQLHNNRAGMSDVAFMQQAKHYNAELAKGKEMLNRLVHFAHQYHQQQQAREAQQAQQQSQQQAQQQQHGRNTPIPGAAASNQTAASGAQPPWVQHGGHTPVPSFSQGQAGMPPHPQPSPSQRPMQPNAPMPPNRSISTPHQGGAPQHGQFIGANQPGASNFPPGATMAVNAPVPALEKERFEKTYEGFVKHRGITRDMRALPIEGRTLDPHTLHSLVMSEGGFQSVSQRDYWPVIAGRMNYVQFPGNDVEPPKSGPATALAVEQIYKEFLAPFEMAYSNSVIDARRKYAASLGQAQMAQSNAVPNVPRNMPNAQQMQMILAYADQSVEQLRASGVQEHIINFIEQNRPHLQRTMREQGNFRLQLRNPPGTGANQQHPGGEGGMNPAAMMPNRPFSTTPAQNPGHMMHQAVNAPNAQHFGPNTGADPSVQNHPPGQTPQQKTMIMSNLVRGNQEQLQRISAMLQNIKSEFLQNRMPNLPPVPVAPEQRQEYNTVVEQLHRAAMDIDHKLPMLFFFLKNEAWVRKIAIIIVTVQQQRTYLSSSNARFIVSLDNLRHMLTEIQKAHESFNNAIQSVTHGGMMSMPQRPPVPSQQNGPPNLPQQMPAPQTMPAPVPPARMPNAPTPSASTPSAHPAASSPASVAAPLLKKKASMQGGAVASPPASAPTPTNAPTPSSTTNTLSDKSPKPKPKPKQAPKRRASKVQSTPTVEAASITTASPSAGVKRPREEETTAPSGPGATPPFIAVANEPSPPKKAKTDEWEGPRNDALKQREEQAAKVKTEEQAAEYFQQMTELIKMAAGGEGQESLSSDISDAFDVILKTYGEGSDPSSSGAPPSSLGLGEAGSSIGTRPASPPLDEYDFFDFSSFETEAAAAVDEDDAGSKAPTPDLISSSSTNPSPESNSSEGDGTHHALTFSDFKSEEPSDPLRLSTMKEVDGGESTYYQSTEWKWDGPMATLDQPWAIFTS